MAVLDLQGMQLNVMENGGGRQLQQHRLRRRQHREPGDLRRQLAQPHLLPLIGRLRSATADGPRGSRGSTSGAARSG